MSKRRPNTTGSLFGGLTPPRSTLGFLLGSCVLLLSGYALSTTPAFALEVPIALAMCGPLLLVLLHRGAPTIDLREPRYWVWFALTVGTLLSAFFDRGGSPLNSALGLSAFITCALLLTIAVPWQSFLSAFIRAMDWIAAIGVAATVAIVYGGLRLPLSTVVNDNQVAYLNGYLFFLVDLGEGILPRALGVFWEPGLFASFLVVAVLAELCLVERRANRWRLALYAVAVLLTQSTAGYILLLFTCFVAFFSRRGRGTDLAFLGSLIVGLLSSYSIDRIIAVLAASQPDVFGKISDGGFLSETRWNSLLVNWDLFSQSPLVGMGLGGASESFSASMDTMLRAQTSTSGFFIAAIGVSGVLYTGAWVLGVLRQTSVPPYARVWMLVCVLVIVNKEPHTTILFSYCFLFYLLADRPPRPAGPVVATLSEGRLKHHESMPITGSTGGGA